MARQGLPVLNHVLQHTLRGLCSDSQWVYAVFWRIIPRSYPPPKWENEGGAMDRSKGNKRNWILVWEDGFCDFSACSAGREAKAGARYGTNSYHIDDSSEPAMQPDVFFKMSHEVYNYGEGLMGKVAADNSHKWVYKEPMEHEISFLSPWHGSLDPHPRTWEAQFKAGIQTVALISVRGGLLQLGSLKKALEDLNFVIMMQRKFNYLQSIPGVFVPHPSPQPSNKRNNALDGSPPPDVGCWTGDYNRRDQRPVTGLLVRSNSEPFRSTTGHSSEIRAALVGIKRPNEDIPQTLRTGRDFPFLSPAVNFSGSPRFSCGQLSRSPECPSPPKALNTGRIGNQTLLPSVSSLHNLLSKLPSVTAKENGSPLSSSPSVLNNLSLSGQLLHSHSFSPQSLGTGLSSDSQGLAGTMESHGSMVGDQDPSPDRSSPPHQSGVKGSSSRGDSGGGGGGGGTVSRHDTGRSTVSETSSSQRQQRQHSSWQSSDHAEQEQAQATGMSDPHHHHHRPDGSKDKIPSFLNSFDQDGLSDFGLHEDLLENSDAYNSFLSEIIS